MSSLPDHRSSPIEKQDYLPSPASPNEDAVSPLSAVFTSSYQRFPDTEATGALTVKAHIADSASKNSELLVTLKDTSDAPAALQHLNVHISILEDEISTHNKEVDEIIERVAARLKQHKKFSESTARKLAYRATLMHEKWKVKKEEKETGYHSALQDQVRAEQRKRLLEETLNESIEEASVVEEAAKKHTEAHALIDELYDSIFAGPTPGFQDEDAKEAAFYYATKKHEEGKQTVLARRRAIKLIEQTVRNLRSSFNYLRQARFSVKDSLFLVFSDAFDNLGNFDHYRTQTVLALERATLNLAPLDEDTHKMVQEIQYLVNTVNISKEAYASKQTILPRIEESTEKLKEARTALDTLLATGKDKEKEARETIRITARTLEDARSALEQCRQVAFESVAGFGVAPPAYQNCCDRAQAFETEVDNSPPNHDDDDILNEKENPPSIHELEAIDSEKQAYQYPQQNGNGAFVAELLGNSLYLQPQIMELAASHNVPYEQLVQLAADTQYPHAQIMELAANEDYTHAQIMELAAMRKNEDGHTRIMELAASGEYERERSREQELVELPTPIESDAPANDRAGSPSQRTYTAGSGRSQKGNSRSGLGPFKRKETL